MSTRAHAHPSRIEAHWREPVRALATLLSFANTEEDGGRDILAAAERTNSAELRAHLRRHAEDELRHAALFRAAAATLRARGVQAPEHTQHRYDLRRAGRDELDPHGFLASHLYDERGEVAYVAFLHVAESRAAEHFGAHASATATLEPELARLFDEVLRDEKYHVAYTARCLEQWRRAGRAREVEAALRRARSSRAAIAWKQLGLRSAAGFGTGVLYVTYWALFTPFALLARLSSRTRNGAHNGGWKTCASVSHPLEGQA
jgi:rubrerythrin